MEDLIWHNPPERPQGQGGKFVRENEAGAVAEAFRERNLGFAREGEQNST